MIKARIEMSLGLSFVCFLVSTAQPPVGKLKITPLTGDFYIYTTYHVLDGAPYPANGMYLVTGSGVILFDSPWDTTQFQPLLDSIAQRHHQRAVICIATHSHDDRTAGLEYYRSKGIQTYTTKMTDDICKARHNKRAAHLMYKDTVFSVGGHRFQTYYPGPGHSRDNIVIWFGKEKILYGGCFIKSVEANDLGYLGDADVKSWREAIKKIQRTFPQPTWIITGHQDWTDNSSMDHTLELISQQLKKQ